MSKKTARTAKPTSEPTNESFYLNEKPRKKIVTNETTRMTRLFTGEKKMFLLPTGAAGNSFINKMTRMTNAWVYDTPNFKSKDQLKSLEKRLKSGRKEV